MKLPTQVWIALLALPLAGALGCAGAAQEAAPRAEVPVSSDAHPAPHDAAAKAAEPAAEAEPFGRLTIEELEARMSEAKAGKLTLGIYDNNHKDRFEKGHIPGAKWVKATELQASDLPAQKEATLVFYCANEH
jgi:hypothetical protein